MNCCKKTYDIEKLKVFFDQRSEDLKLFYFQEIDSTNDFLLLKMDEIPVNRSVCLCEVQKKGKGRFQRKWQNIAFGQITLSYLYKTKTKLHYFQILSIAIALECLMALEKVGFSTIKIKWPNDLYIIDKNTKTNEKLAGVLIETRTNQQQSHIVIGLGLNIFDRIKPFASLEKINPGLINKLTKNEIAILMILAIEKAIANLEKSKTNQYINLFDQYDLFHNKIIRFKKLDGEVIEGLNTGIGELSELLINQDGKKIHLSQGRIIV